MECLVVGSNAHVRRANNMIAHENQRRFLINGTISWKERKKIRRYADMTKQNEAHFLPIVFTAFGGTGRFAARALALNHLALAQTVFRHHRGGVRGFQSSLARAVACSLVRGNGKVLRAALHQARRMRADLNDARILREALAPEVPVPGRT